MSNVILKMTPKRIYPILRHDAQNAPIDLAHRRSAEYFGGVGFIAGRFPGTLTVDGQPAARVIECRTRDNRKLVATTWSSPVDGTYVFHNINADLEYDLIARDHNRVYSDVIIPAVKAWPYLISLNTPDYIPEGYGVQEYEISGASPPYQLVTDFPEVILSERTLTIDVTESSFPGHIEFSIEDASGGTSSKSIDLLEDIYIHDDHEEDVISLMRFNDNVIDTKPNSWQIRGAGRVINNDPFYRNLGVFHSGGGNLTAMEPGLVLGTDPFTIEMWFYPISAAAWGRIFQIGTNITPGSLAVYADGAVTGIGIQYRPASVWVNLFDSQLPPNTLSLERWNHIALTRDEDDVFRFFVNGVKMRESLPIAYDISESRITLSSNPESTEAFNAMYDDVRITKGVCRYTDDFEIPIRF